MPPSRLAVIRQIHGGTQACVGLDDGDCSDTLDVGQSLEQGCVFVPPLFDMFFTAALRVAGTRFLTDTDITDNISSSNKMRKARKRALHAQAKSTGGGGRREEVQRLWDMLYADDADIVSPSSERLEGMMTVIVMACSSFGLTVSEAKTEGMCLQTKGGEKVSCTINAAGQIYKQTIKFVYLGMTITADRDLGMR